MSCRLPSLAEASETPDVFSSVVSAEQTSKVVDCNQRCGEGPRFGGRSLPAATMPQDARKAPTGNVPADARAAQLKDLAGLLKSDPAKVKSEFRRLNLQLTFHPTEAKPRPHLHCQRPVRLGRTGLFLFAFAAPECGSGLIEGAIGPQPHHDSIEVSRPATLSRRHWAVEGAGEDGP